MSAAALKTWRGRFSQISHFCSSGGDFFTKDPQLLPNHKNLDALKINEKIIQKTLEQHHVNKRKKSTANKLRNRKQKSSKKPDLLNHCETYYVINDCNERGGVSVANLNAKAKKIFFFDQQPSEQNNTAEQ